MTTVLVTGSAGFVGSHLCEHLIKNTDWQIVGIDSFKHRGDSERTRHLDPARYRIVCHDLCAPISARTQDAIGHVDFVMNLAAMSHVDASINDPVPFVENNVKLALNVAEYARRVKPAMLVQCSTDEVFGPAHGDEGHGEWYAHRPSNPYAASKAAADDILHAYWRCYGVPLVKTHCMNMIGERQDTEKFVPHVIRSVIRGDVVTIHGRPDCIGSRLYLHARNLADAWLFLMSKTDATRYDDTKTGLQEPDVYNIAGLEEVDNLAMAEKIAEFVGKPLRYEFVDFHAARPGHDRKYRLDSSKITRLGWTAPVPLWDSLRKTVEWTLRPENKRWLDLTR